MMKQLEDIPRNSPFKIPEGYFDEVNRKIVSMTSEAEKQSAKVSVIRPLRPYLLAAASVSLFIVLGYTSLRIINAGKHHPGTEMISDEALAPYLNEIDIYSLEQSAVSIQVQEKMPEAGRNEIIDYLMFENIDINEIYEQL
jgi:hypothetical protein